MMTKKKTRTSAGISSQKVIKIDGKLWDELDHWLQTPDAKKSGFHSKADFATQAVREMLTKYSVDKRAYEKFVDLFHHKSSELKDVNVNNLLEFIQYLENLKLKTMNKKSI